MRKLIYTLVLVVIGFTASYAQTTKMPSASKLEKIANIQVDKLDALVKITEDQRPKLLALEIDRQTRREEMKALGDTATAEQKASMKQWYKAYPARLQAILTPEQYRIYKEDSDRQKASRLKSK